ncbi:MAG: divalent-cation tolerance protein CutA [Candidatus Hodarchaeota archaeon]
MFVAVYTTVSNIDEAKKFGHNLIQKKLVACVNIIPNVQSIYHWKGKIEEEAEVILWCKTHERLIKKIQDVFQESHPYELPALAIYPIHSGSESYLKWIDDQTQISDID